MKVFHGGGSGVSRIECHQVHRIQPIRAAAAKTGRLNKNHPNGEM